MKLFKCEDMERALFNAHRADHAHLVVRRVYHNEVKIPIRLNRLAGLPYYFYQPWKPESHGQLAVWQQKGGLLLDHTPRPSLHSHLGPHDVQLFVEAPHSLYWLEALSRDTTEASIVYIPPGWEEHAHRVHVMSPERSVYAAGAEFLRDRVFAEQDRYRLSYMAAEGMTDLKHPCTLVSNKEVADAVGIPKGSVGAIRRFFYAFTPYHFPYSFVEMTLNARPLEPYLQEFWDFLESRRIDEYQRLLISTVMMWKHTPRFTYQLKEMNKVGYITMLERYYPYCARPDTKFDFELAAKDRRAALTEFRALRNAVNRAPYYPVPYLLK